MSTAAPLPNPYVGPRSYTSADPAQGRKLYGRSRELQELLQLLIAERIVLLFSPSGAGKSSLINAALTPALVNAEFRVLPVMRVAHEPRDPALRQVAGFNRYVLSALMSLEEGRDEGQQLDPKELAGMTLAGYLGRRFPPPVREGDARAPAEPLALVFDQFEEILTLDPTDIAAKREFFAQAGEALRDLRYWTLFSMREEYVAALDPFVGLIPTAFSSTYRLDLLGERAARLAIRKPAGDRSVEFAAEAADSLVNDLRAVMVQQLSGRAEQQLGPHVDPVQLQVVCYRLWERLPVTAATRSIGLADLKKGGDVNDALAGYYSDSVAAVVAKGYATERDVRGWVGRHLITGQNIRGQVLRGEGNSEGLDNHAVDELIKAHLLRPEQRRGATWIELAHDRLIEPIRKNNAEHRHRLQQFQRQGEEWQKTRPEWLLLRGGALKDAEEWSGQHPTELSSLDREFLAACKQARRQGVVSRVLGVATLCLMLTTTAGAILSWGWYQKQKELTQLQSDLNKEQKALTTKLQEREANLERSNEQLASIDRVKDVYVAQAQYKAIAAAPNLGRSDVTIQYFFKDGDSEDVFTAIRRLGFTLEKKPGLNNVPTNFVRYTPHVNLEDVRRLCVTLISSNVPLTSVGCFDRPRRESLRDKKIIQVGAGVNYQGEPLWTIERLKLLPECPPATAADAGGEAEGP